MLLSRASLGLFFGGLLAVGCAPAPSGDGPGTGGASTGGTKGTTGGAPGSGGAAPASGGSTAPGSGGSMASGGAPGSGGAIPSGGATGSGGSVGLGGALGSGGSTVTGSGGAGMGGTGGRGGTAGSGGAAVTGGRSGSGGGAAGGTSGALAKFGFFVASYPSLSKLSGKPEGFGGDLRFGKADGLTGADELCRQVAELGMAGAGQKTWRAFLSATASPGGGGAVNARDRIGAGPWYDAMGRLVAMNVAGLFAADRPAGDAVVVNDLPNEFGQPNHYVGANGFGATTVDNHDTLTGSDISGRLRATSAVDTCSDWTSTTVAGRPWIGHSWPRSATSGRQWASDHQVPGCTAGVDRTLGGTGSGSCVGCSGGYGGFFCFALP